MKVLSLFDGISCGMVALERVGINVERYVAYEIEENAIKVSKDNYPKIEQKGDVFKATYTEGEFDILIGGSPCTYWSIAKAGDGRETTSSGFGWELFMQYVRALKEVKPKYFLYENNESMSDDIKNEITKQLGVEPIMIDSADFSAQIRKRYYWTNIPVDLNYIKSDLVLSDILYEHEYKVRDFTKYKETVRWNKENTICRYDSSGKGYYSQASRCRKPCIKSNTLTASGNDKNNIWLEDYKCRTLHPIEAERLQTLPDDYTKCLTSKIKRSEVCGNGWTVDVIAHILKGLK
jgi:DNA (cytosine-5)-methyltransferase 3A